MKRWEFLMLPAVAAMGSLRCSQVQQMAGGLGGGDLGAPPIAKGLQEALNLGIERQVTKLTATDGFFGNPLVKIAFPPEIATVESGLRRIGAGALADEGTLMLNRAAEDAVKEATPIFVDAVATIDFESAMDILKGDQDAATLYLQKRTTEPLYGKFNPVVRNSFDRVGARKVWSGIINRYNSIPLTKEVNPDLDDHVTNQSLDGVYKMIAVEEKNIRTDLSARSTDVLRQVFALQD